MMNPMLKMSHAGPEVENVALGLRRLATFSTSSSSYNVTRTTLLHMFCRMANH